ncbi:MAG: FAD:protein FMN transferase [Acidobacteriota bacterium]
MRKYLLLAFIILLALCCQPSKHWHQSTVIFFDTVCELRVFCSSSEFAEAKDKVKRIFSSIEDLFGPGQTETQSSTVKSLLKKSIEIYKKTEGCFDITIGPLKEAWGFMNGDHRIPSKEEIKDLMKKIGMEKIQVENNGWHVPPQAELDWGAIAKGYGIDLASNALIRMNIEKGFINAGGDIFCWGENPDKKDWKIGIQHPRKKIFLGIISMTDMGAATSGDYQKFFIENGVRYHHIFNPFTGYPVRGKQSVTVIGPKTVFCDALSTAVFVSDKPENILKKYPDYGAVIVYNEDQIIYIGKKYDIDFDQEIFYLDLHGH